MKKLFLPITILAIFASCDNKKINDELYNYTVQGDTISIPENSNLTTKIKTEIVQTTPYRLHVQTAGTVKAIPTQYAEVAPPFQGRVIKSYLKLGMKTTAETPLFEISSPDFMVAQKIRYTEQKELVLSVDIR